ncbi:MAG TPA: transposase, partial [Nocardioidaceae bacterium]|nr:transposase [Nocardioidaceae bacterium]
MGCATPTTFVNWPGSPRPPENSGPPRWLSCSSRSTPQSRPRKPTPRPPLPSRGLTSFQNRYRSIIAQGWAAHPPPPPTGKQGRPKLGPAGSLVRRLDIYQDDVLRFATDFTVAFDNNQAERDIRMIRLQQKISGGWRTEAGADVFLTVRSYLSTARKHHRKALEVLTELFTGSPWIPAPT